MRLIKMNRDLNIDPHIVSLQRVSADPSLKVSAAFYRPPTGSTATGAPAEYLACTVTGSRAPYGSRVSGVRPGDHTDLGISGSERWRLEVPTPTDENGVTVDARRNDRVMINGQSYLAVGLTQYPGYVEVLLEQWN